MTIASSDTESISPNRPGSSDGKSVGLGTPTNTIPSTSPKLEFPKVLGSWSSSKSKGNWRLFDASLKSQDFAGRTIHEEGDIQGSMKSNPKPESWNSVFQSILVEQPFHRATGTRAEKVFEEPLRQSMGNNIPTAFRDMKAVIAVDVSGSTRGRVIEQEARAAQSICSNFSEVAAAQTTIIPWDHRLHTFTTAKDAWKLKSKGGGTSPSALTSNSTSVNALGNCSAWLLFTDGKIDDREIRHFSRGLCTNGLHGTACIVVLFGYKCERPVDCDISVGISIFGMAPDCLFLFHDIESGIVSIFQSKGIFNGLLPNGHGVLSLDEHTQWWELPTINYNDLSQIEIPAPRRLNPGDILLQSNRTVRLNDIYNDKVDAATASELLEVEDNLKTLLLTSEINGQNNNVKNWIEKQKMKSRDMLHIPRPDVQSAAAALIRELLLARLHPKDKNQKKSLQAKLRIAHKQNWVTFISDTDAETKKVSRRAEVVHSALDRATSNAVESSRGSWSAKMIAPILASGPKKSFGKTLLTVSTIPSAPSPLAKYQEPAKESSTYQPIPPSTAPFNPLPGQIQHLSHPSDSSNGGESPVHIFPDTDVLFIPGYKYSRIANSSAAFEGECPLCGDMNAILALLVKEPMTGLVTPGFPGPKSRGLLEFPLTIGMYPEAEVLSSFVCCDSCAYHLVKMRKSPYGEDILGAIPLIPEAFFGNFQQVTLDTLDNALSKRFEKSALEQVFLSILYSTLMNIKDDCEETEKTALHWAASLLSTSISIPANLRTTFNIKYPSIGGNITLRPALSNNLNALSEPNPSLLQYPLGGFVVLIRCMVDLGLDPSPNLLKNAVFQRILYYITEKYHESLDVNGRDATIKGIRTLTWSPESQSETIETLGSPFSDDTFDIISVPLLSVPILTLTQTGLLSIQDWELLQKLGPLFAHVKDSCHHALAVFLHILCRETRPDRPDSKPMEMFDRIRAQEAFRLVFEKPQIIGEIEAKELIGLVSFGTPGAGKSEMLLPQSSEGGVASICNAVESPDFDMLSEESYGGAW